MGPLHKQVTLLSNGLLCHSCIPPRRSLSTFTLSRFLPDGYSDEWVRERGEWPPAALHEQQAIKKRDSTEREMEESDISWGNIKIKSAQSKEAEGYHDPQCFAADSSQATLNIEFVVKMWKSSSLSLSRCGHIQGIHISFPLVSSGQSCKLFSKSIFLWGLKTFYISSL